MISVVFYLISQDSPLASPKRGGRDGEIEIVGEMDKWISRRKEKKKRGRDKRGESM